MAYPFSTIPCNLEGILFASLSPHPPKCGVCTLANIMDSNGENIPRFEKTHYQATSPMMELINYPKRTGFYITFLHMMWECPAVKCFWEKVKINFEVHEFKYSVICIVMMLPSLDTASPIPLSLSPTPRLLWSERGKFLEELISSWPKYRESEFS
jgi:hypothetical protein